MMTQQDLLPKKRYNVKYDFTKFQPKWTWMMADKYGKHNEGFEIQAYSIEDVKLILKTKFNLNPFYLKITEL